MKKNSIAVKYLGKSGTLLSRENANSKLAKSLHGETPIMSVPLHLAPAKLSGYNVCAMSTASCRAVCIHFAGNPAYAKNKDKARIARTKLFFEHRTAFMLQLVREIAIAKRRAANKGMQLAVRLNATSDIRWESVMVYETTQKTIFDMFPDVQFYDYTKLLNRKHIPPNYHLTFSLAENNEACAIDALANNMNVAIVFDTKRTKQLPTFYILGNKSYRVLDGDLTDYRPSDRKGCIIGLRAKGKARALAASPTGFIRPSATLP